MKETVYIESSVIGYCTLRPSTNLIVAARQALILNWWESSRNSFDCFVSTVVLSEIGTGDEVAVMERLAFVNEIPILEVTKLAEKLAQMLLEKNCCLKRVMRMHFT